MPSNSRPSLTDPNPNSTYLFSVARLLRTRPNTVRSSTPPPRELILRTPSTKLRPLRTNHPYKRIHNTSNSDRENHQPAPVDDRFLEAIALLAQNENEDHIQDAHPPVPPQRWTSSSHSL
ncbi:hypothetical protein VKT23_009263 [Stygiomarasmius scandens]|uniref:Uncharacterized protein n=1 Tax=Marasmiellus scandens TaxID=2682957 RepID=A0ABR1JEX7_9AGAR